MRMVLALLAVCASTYAADERPADFASAARIESPPQGSHFRIRLPAPVYQATVQRGPGYLSDLRVVNAQEEFVPFAFAPRELQRAAPETRALKLFPLYGDEARSSMEGLALRVERSASGTVVKVDSTDAPRGARRRLLGYLAELPELARPMQALSLDWSVKEGFTGSVRVEASDDLKRWETLARAPVIQLEHAGERLERKRVDTPPSRAKYLRISFSGVPADFALKGMDCELAPVRPEPARESLSLVGKQDAEKKNDYQFDTGGSFPVDRIRFALPQANTIAPVQVLARERPEDSWRPLASATVYRLSRDGAEILSPDIALGPVTNRYWLLRVDARAGGLGAGEVQLVASWQPHEVVFTARGAAPFSLLVGSKSAAPAALPLATILPGYKDGDMVVAASARLGELGANAAAARKSGDPIASAREFAASGEGRKWILWTVLVAGVLLVIWMATRLMREMGKAQSPPRRDSQP